MHFEGLEGYRRDSTEPHITHSPQLGDHRYCGLAMRWSLLIDTQAGMLRLLPAQTHDIVGGPDPTRWEYQVTVGGPSETETHNNVPATSVLHFKYAIDPERPWRDNSPLDVARLAGRLSAETINALANESSGPRGQLLGLPVDGNDPTMSALKSDIGKAKGRMAFLQTGD